MPLTTGEWVTIGVAVFNAVVVPVAIFALRAMIDKSADARAASLRKDLHEHEQDDEKRFNAMSSEVTRNESVRDNQHVENQRLLSALKTDTEWLKRALSPRHGD